MLLPKLGRGRPTELDPNPPPEANRPDLPPWMKVETLAGELATDAPDLRVLHPDAASGVRYGCETDAEPPGLPATEEYADCWRGVLLCEADPEGLVASGPHRGRFGAVRLFGDMAIMPRVFPSLNRPHFTPWRGVGGPTDPPR